MRKIAQNRSTAFLLVILSFIAATRASAQQVHLPPHEKFVLKNGLTVLLLEKHGVPLIDIFAIVKSGSAADPSGQEGLAAVTAGLLRKGTKTRTAQQFAADMDFIGGSFDANASADFTTISAEFLTKDFEKGLDLFADALLHPTLPQDETQKLLAQTLDAVKGAKDDPQSVLGLYYNGYLFGAASYGRSSVGDEISLTKIERAAVANFYQKYYTPGNTILAIAGDFPSAELRKKLEATFDGWPAGTEAHEKIVPGAPVRGKRLLLIDKPDASQTYFGIGNIGVARDDPDRVAIRVVNTIFGGSFTSMLNEELRVKSGYTYGASSFFDERKLPGAFGIFSFTKNETTTQAIDLALQVQHDLHKNGVTPEQLASAKNYIKGQFPTSLETSKQLAEIIAVHDFYGLGDDEVNEFAARVDAVTPEAARRVIDKHFPDDNVVLVLIGKTAEIGHAVEKYAEKRDQREISDPGFWPPPQKK